MRSPDKRIKRKYTKVLIVLQNTFKYFSPQRITMRFVFILTKPRPSFQRHSKAGNCHASHLISFYYIYIFTLTNNPSPRYPQMPIYPSINIIKNTTPSPQNKGLY